MFVGQFTTNPPGFVGVYGCDVAVVLFAKGENTPGFVRNMVALIWTF